MLKKEIPKEFWLEAINTTMYFLNKCPIKVVWNMTLFEAWSGRKSFVIHLKAFGCVSYAQATKEKRTKLE